MKRSEPNGDQKTYSLLVENAAINAAKIRMLQSTIADLHQLVAKRDSVIEKHDLVIKEKQKDLETKNAECEDLTAKNRELASENAALKEKIASLEEASESQAQTVFSLQYSNDEAERSKRQAQIAYFSGRSSFYPR